MYSSPLKKKFNLTLNTSRGTRTSFQDPCTSKSPFKCNTDQIIKCNQLEQELHRANQHRKLLELELDDLKNQYKRKSCALHDSEIENFSLKQQIQVIRQQQEIQKLQHNLKQKNQNQQQHKLKFQENNQEYEKDLQYQIKQQKEQNETMKEQLIEITLQYKIIQDSYQEIKEERHSIYQKLVESQAKNLLQDEKIKKLERLEKEITIQQNQIKQLTDNSKKLQDQIKSQGQIQEKKEKWKIRYKNFKNEIDYQQLRSRKSSDSEEQLATLKQTSDQDNLIEELNEIKDKLQQLEIENQYLREENFEMKTQLQRNTDKLLKQQLQNSLTKEHIQSFSFQQCNYEYQESNFQQQEIQ